MNQATLTFVHALSPLHAGTGQGVGVIDLPVAREKATNLPFLPGSTLKGSLRDEAALNHFIANGSQDNDDARKAAKDSTDDLFGNRNNGTADSGAVIFTDQKLLCLPVRSLFGTFAWVTSPFILERFNRDCESIGNEIKFHIPKIETEKCAIYHGSSKLQPKQSKVILEDLDLDVDDKADAKLVAEKLGEAVFAGKPEWQTLFNERFCIVSDDVMNFLAETATEVSARNVLNENKTSKNLWYEESLPTETILSGLLVVANKRKIDENLIDQVRGLVEKPIQLGGKMTVGRGLCRVTIAANKETN